MNSLRRCSAKPLLGLFSVLLCSSLQDSPSFAQEPAPENISQLLERTRKLNWASRYEEAQNLLQERLAQKPLEPTDQVALQNALADVHYAWAWQLRGLEVPDYEAAIRHYWAAYESDKVWRRKAAGRDLTEIGGSYFNLQNYEEALKYWTQTLDIKREIKDRPDEAHTLINISFVCQKLDRYKDAVAYYDLALPIYEELGNPQGKAMTLNSLLFSYDHLNMVDESRLSYNQLLLVLPKIRNNNAALYFYNQTSPWCRKFKDRAGEAAVLRGIGLAYANMRRREEAINSYKLALPIYRGLKDRNSEAATLFDIGRTLQLMSRFEDALHFYNLSLRIYRTSKDQMGAASTLYNIGRANRLLNRYDEALRSLRIALSLYRTNADQGGEARALLNIGMIYQSLGQLEKAQSTLNMALAIYMRIRDRSGQALVTNSIAYLYAQKNRLQEALQLFKTTLGIYEQLNDREGQSRSLNNISGMNMRMGRYQEALRVANLALPLARAIKNQHTEILILRKIGVINAYLKRPSEALHFLNASLPLCQAVKDRAIEVNILDSLSWVYANQKQPQLAILHGKQAVNLLQSIRRDNQALDQNSKDTFLGSNAATYRQLARLLIEAGRFAEADEVLSMLQQQEFLDYVNGDQRSIAFSRDDATYQPLEEKTVKEQKRKISSVVLLSAQASRLRALSQPTEVQKAQLADVQSQLKAADDDLDQFFIELPSRFPKIQTSRERSSLANTRALLRSLGGKAAYISTFVDDKGLDLLVTLPSGPTVHLAYKPTPTKPGEQNFTAWLNTRINNFNKAIQKRQNVNAQARELYNVLFCRGQLADQLNGIGTSTLMWRLTGTLRAVPFAALRDEDGYLVEKYANLMLTAGSTAQHLAHVPARNWRILGAGISQPRTVGTLRFDPLPGARAEMRAIIHDPSVGFTGGVLPGHVLFNEKFTKSALMSALGNQTRSASSKYQVVHFSCHFEAGASSSDSFLLTADKQPLTLANLQALGSKKPLFPGVELVTLSACNTAKNIAGGGADSLAALAEFNGAKAVLATLWPIADQQTPQLMTDFYSIYKTHRNKGKAWALQHAQLKMLKRGGNDVHPYFWAPFTLTGNGR